MYSPRETVVTRTRYEFKVAAEYGAPHHAVLRDVTDTIHVALARLRDVKGEKASDYDDALHVYVDDDGIVFYFEADA